MYIYAKFQLINYSHSKVLDNNNIFIYLFDKHTDFYKKEIHIDNTKKYLHKFILTSHKNN